MPVIPAIDANSVREHKEALRDAYQRAVGLGVAQRKQLLRTVLQYRLRQFDPRAASSALAQLRAEFADAPRGAAAPQSAPATASDVPVTELHDLVRLVLGERVNAGPDDQAAVRDATKRLQEAMIVLRATLRKPNFSLIELLNRAARDLSAHDTALEHAARESFDRVLSALDPAEAMKATPKKTLATEAMYKAALFDAIKEKHQQLQLYHGKGRLVRDYKSAYKKYVQDETSR